MTVVALHGGITTEMVNETPSEVHEILREAVATANGETHTAIALVLVDKQGRLLTRKYWMDGSAYTLLGALELLKHDLVSGFKPDV